MKMEQIDHDSLHCTQALGKESDSAARLYKRPGSVWNCLWEHALERSPVIYRKSRVSYPGPGFLSSATWPSPPKKHYNGLINMLTMCMHRLMGLHHRLPMNTVGGLYCCRDT